MFAQQNQTSRVKNFSKLLFAFLFLCAFLSPLKASAATLYFCGGASGNWNTLSNWRIDPNCDDSAPAIPAPSDDVIALENITSNSGGPITINTFLLGDLAPSSKFLGINITVLNGAIFSDSSSGGNSNTGIITGDVTFNGSSYNNSLINGNVTFNGSSYNNSLINGNVTFNDSSYNHEFGAIVGNVTFNGTSQNNSTSEVAITGDVTFNDSSSNVVGLIVGNVEFTGSSSHGASITGNVTFRDSSSIFGESHLVNGNVSVYFPVPRPFWVNIFEGVLTYYNYPFYFLGTSDDDWCNVSNWFVDESGSVSSGELPTNSSNSIFIFSTVNQKVGCNPEVVAMTIGNGNSESSIGFNIPITITDTLTVVDGGFLGNGADVTGQEEVIFNGSSYNNGTVNGTTTFNGSASNGGGTINGNAIFNDTSGNGSVINGNAIFYQWSSNSATINGDATFNDTSFDQGYGITGDVYLNTTYYSDGSLDGNGVFHVDQNGWAGTISGTLYGPDSLPVTTIIFSNESINSGTFTSGAVFNDTSYNAGTITGDVAFNDTSYNAGTITGDVAFNDTSYNAGSLEGSTITFNTSSYNDSGGTVYGDTTFNGASFNTGSISAFYVTFNDSSYNSNFINGDVVTFNDSTYNNGFIEGDAIFTNDSSELMVGSPILGVKTRLYISSLTTSRDFVTDGPWTVVADGEGVAVNVVDAVYDETTTFSELNGGYFLFDAPTLSSSPASSLTATSAALNASITILGGPVITTRGFTYGLTSSDHTATSSTTGVYTATSTYSQTVTDLTCNTTYFFRAFAINEVGTGTSTESTFTTSACPVIASVSSQSSRSSGTSAARRAQNLAQNNLSSTATPTIQNPLIIITPSPKPVPVSNTIPPVVIPIKTPSSTTVAPTTIATSSEVIAEDIQVQEEVVSPTDSQEEKSVPKPSFFKTVLESIKSFWRSIF